MPRRSSSGRSGGYGRSTGGGYRSYNSGRASPRPNYSNTQSTTTPRSQQTSMPYVPQRGIGLGGAMATGMAFGGGSAIGHSVIGGLMGNREGYGETANTQNPQNTQIDPYSTSQQTTQQEINKNPCFDFGQKFIECLKENQSEISKCQIIMNDLNYCQKSMI